MAIAESVRLTPDLQTPTTTQDDDLSALLAASWRDRAVQVVTTHPKASIAGAFVIGFLLARAIRALTDEG